MKNFIFALGVIVLVGVTDATNSAPLKKPPVLISAADIVNTDIKGAIQKLTDSPTDANRKLFYRALSEDGFLLIAIQKEPSPPISGAVVLELPLTLSVLTTQAPGGGVALLAFTDKESLLARSPNSKYIGVSVKQLLERVLAEQDAGLLINPAGPWAGVPLEDIKKILDGTFK